MEESQFDVISSERVRPTLAIELEVDEVPGQVRITALKIDPVENTVTDIAYVSPPMSADYGHRAFDYVSRGLAEKQ